LGEGWTEGVHPEDREACLATFHSAFDKREPFAVEYRLRKADGTYGWIYDQGNPKIDQAGTFTGYLGACTDITEICGETR
jgi:two-component system CheB/CheR fusion protein